MDFESTNKFDRKQIMMQVEREEDKQKIILYEAILEEPERPGIPYSVKGEYIANMAGIALIVEPTRNLVRQLANELSNIKGTRNIKITLETIQN